MLPLPRELSKELPDTDTRGDNGVLPDPFGKPSGERGREGGLAKGRSISSNLGDIGITFALLTLLTLLRIDMELLSVVSLEAFLLGVFPDLTD
mmetsp:Transcript_17443/g.17537  ORF Transcript_17443/g.17537 Transcript_17443/m.17537 type:complete len:93 (-) Transcript_17443:1117-1395(-)